jgi:MFS family permease
MLLMALGLAMIGFGIFWLARLTIANLAGLFIAGLGVANLFPITLSLCTTVAADQIDKASARISLGTGSAILLAPLFLGWLADQMRIENAFAIVAILIIVALIVTALTNRFVSGRI